MEVVRFKNGKFGVRAEVRAEGGGICKSPYLFLRNADYLLAWGSPWADPYSTQSCAYEFESEKSAKEAFVKLRPAGIDYGQPINFLNPRSPEADGTAR